MIDFNELADRFEGLSGDLRNIAILYSEGDYQQGAFKLGDLCGKCTIRAKNYRDLAKSDPIDDEEM